VLAQTAGDKNQKAAPGAVAKTTTEKETLPVPTQFNVPGARFLIPGRTLLIVSEDGTPPAVVEGKEVSWDEYNMALSRAAQSKFYHAKVPEQKEAEIRTQVAEEIVLDKLMMKYAKEQEIKPDEAWVKAQVDNLELRYKGNEKWEQQREKTVPKLVAEFEKQSTLKRLEEQARKVADPAESVIKAYYDENAEFFTQPSTQRVSVILLGVDPSSHTSVWDKAKIEAEGVLKKINSGGDFAAVARLRSTDASADQGGDLGYIHKGMLSDDAQKVVDAMEPGQVSEPLRILQGYALFKLHDVTKSKKMSYEKSKERAKALYLRAASNKQWEDLKIKLRKEGKVSINPVLTYVIKIPGEEPADSTAK